MEDELDSKQNAILDEHGGQSKLFKAHSPSTKNFHSLFLKFGMWPEMSFQKQMELRREYTLGKQPDRDSTPR